MGGNKLCCGPVVEVGNDVDEVVRESEEYKCPDQLVVVSVRESPFEIQVAKGNVFVTGVDILYVETEARNGTHARKIGPLGTPPVPD